MKIETIGDRIIVDYEHQQITEEEMLEVWRLVQAHLERLHERGSIQGTPFSDEATWLERIQRDRAQRGTNG